MPNNESTGETTPDGGRNQRDSYTEQVTETVTTWPKITTGTGRFNSTTFQVVEREIGHIHQWGPVDIGYPKPLRDQLIADGETGEHHVVPNSNATTFHVETADDIEQAIFLFRLSYLHHVLVAQQRSDLDPELAAIDVSGELATMGVSDDIRDIFEDIRDR